MKFHRLKYCKICKSKKIIEIFSLNKTPLEDSFSEKINKKFNKLYPLDVFLCMNCNYVFLSHFLSQKESYKYYLYISEITLGLKKHFDEYAAYIVKKYHISKNSFCLDIGSNDGSFIRALKKNGMKVLGVEPSKKISYLANKKKLNTINDFFNKKTVNLVKKKYGKPNLITLNYVFANMTHPVSTLELIKSLLDKNGILVIETGYHPIQMGVNNMFDYIYHEHYSYFSVHNLNYLFSNNGFELISVKNSKPKGGSIIVVAQLKDGKRKIEKSVNSFINFEKNIGSNKIKFYKNFISKINVIKNNFMKLIKKEFSNKKKIVGFGASHSTTVLLHYFNLGKYISYLVDDNKIKHGLYSPGYNLRVYDTKRILYDKPDIILLLAWQHQKTILKKYKFHLKSKIKFIIPLPKIKIIN